MGHQRQRSSQIPEQNARPHLPPASKHAGGACRFWPARLAPVCSPGPGCSIQRGWQDSPLQIIVPIDRAHAESPGSSTDPDPGGTPDGVCEPVDLWACEQTESEEARRRGVSSTWCMVRIVPRTMVPGKLPPPVLTTLDSRLSKKYPLGSSWEDGPSLSPWKEPSTPARSTLAQRVFIMLVALPLAHSSEGRFSILSPLLPPAHSSSTTQTCICPSARSRQVDFFTRPGHAESVLCLASSTEFPHRTRPVR